MTSIYRWKNGVVLSIFSCCNCGCLLSKENNAIFIHGHNADVIKEFKSLPSGLWGNQLNIAMLNIAQVKALMINFIVLKLRLRMNHV